MIAAEITFNLDRCADSLRQYAKLTSRTEDDVISYWSGQLAWNVYHGLIAMKAAKGAIRAFGIELLRSGSGVEVRDSVRRSVEAKYGALTQVSSGDTFISQFSGKRGRGKKVVALGRSILKDGKRMNLQALAVEAELNLRESARGFSAFSDPRPPRGADTASFSRGIESRYGFSLSEFVQATSGVERKSALLRWFGSFDEKLSSPATALDTSKQQQVLIGAINSVTSRLNASIESKLADNARATGL